MHRRELLHELHIRDTSNFGANGKRSPACTNRIGIRRDPSRAVASSRRNRNLFCSRPSTAANATISQCHDQKERLGKSTHTGMAYQTCHDGVKAYPHAAAVAKLSCATCHETAVQQFEAGAHARLRRQGNAKAPTCANCHNDVHDTRKANTASFRQDAPKICGNCHVEISRQYQGKRARNEDCGRRPGLRVLHHLPQRRAIRARASGSPTRRCIGGKNRGNPRRHCGSAPCT